METTRYQTYLNLINEEVAALTFEQGLIGEACRYQMALGGKRIRPILLVHLAGQKHKGDLSLPYALALELVHNYSLVHDDLPVMDDDDYRRGQLTIHRKFGEAIAVLTGDALLNKAFELIFEDLALNRQGRSRKIKAGKTLAEFSGGQGMILGQELDMGQDEDVLQMMYHKTAKLFMAACRMGALLAAYSREDLEAAGDFGKHYGLLFQLSDDILDLEEDQANGKRTYVSSFGMDESKRLLDQLEERCLAYADRQRDPFLRDLVLYTSRRS